jgi:XTP/dITP diphosphohydrolase
VTPDGTEVVREGRFTGTLLREPRGDDGFGYDPLFLPDGSDLTAGEMGPARKNAVSHRALAFRSLLEALQAQ